MASTFEKELFNTVIFAVGLGDVLNIGMSKDGHVIWQRLPDHFANWDIIDVPSWVLTWRTALVNYLD